MDLIERRDAINLIHKTIYRFFDIVDDESEEPMSEKDKLLLEVNKAVSNGIKELPPAERWIPVSERLPEDGIDVLVTDDSGGYATIGIDCMYTKKYSGERDWFEAQRVTAWMPLPEPYKEKKNNANKID